MLLRIKGKNYYFSNAYLDMADDTVIIEHLTDTTREALRLTIEGNPITALQIIASILSEYQIVADLDDELESRGYGINTIKLAECDEVEHRKILLPDRVELLDDIVCITDKGVSLANELVHSPKGIFLIHTRGTEKLLTEEQVTVYAFDHVLDELLTSKKERKAYIIL